MLQSYFNGVRINDAVRGHESLMDAAISAILAKCASFI